ncbi:MAG: hypothetical protein ACFFDT_22035 [Candidatus Hodarchaeota archaeon]
MIRDIDYVKSFQLVERYGSYRQQKAWGMMVIVTGIVVTFLRLQFHIMVWLVETYQSDVDYHFYRLLVPIVFILFFGSWILPLLLTVTAYFSVKRMKIEGTKISSKRYLFFALILFCFYIFNTFLSEELEPLIYPILFPSLIKFEEGAVAIYYDDSHLPLEAVKLFTRGLLFVILYFILKGIIRVRSIKELLPPGGLLFLQFLIVTIAYHWIHPTDLDETFLMWVTTILYAICYLGSGLYSLKKASQILEGNE